MEAAREISRPDNPGIFRDSGIVPDGARTATRLALLERFVQLSTWEDAQCIVEERAMPSLTVRGSVGVRAQRRLAVRTSEPRPSGSVAGGSHAFIGPNSWVRYDARFRGKLT